MNHTKNMTKRIMAMVIALSMMLATLGGYVPGWYTAFAEDAAAQEQPAPEQQEEKPAEQQEVPEQEEKPGEKTPAEQQEIPKQETTSSVSADAEPASQGSADPISLETAHSAVSQGKPRSS